MQTFQSIVIVILVFSILIGAIFILAFGGDIFWILLYIFLIGIPGLILYIFFKIQQSDKSGKPAKKSKPSQPSLFPKIQTPENKVLFTLKKTGFLNLTSQILVIQEKSISVMFKTFFYSVWEDTFPIKSLTGVYINTTLISASLTITRKDPAKEYLLKSLDKNAALKAKEILDGLLLVKESLIKMPKGLSPKEEKEALAKTGKETNLEKEIKK